jgi:hypothetical protein
MHSELLVSVTMQAPREAPPDMQCRDKFLVQSAIVSQEITPKDISGDMVIHVTVGFYVCSLCCQFSCNNPNAVFL